MKIASRMALESRQLDLPDVRIPWVGGPGMFRDSPLFDAWRQAMADYRRTVDDADGP